MGNIKNLVGIVLFSLISSGCSRIPTYNFDDVKEKPRARRSYLPYIEFRADIPQEKNFPYDIREIQKELEIYRVPLIIQREKSTTIIEDIEADKSIKF